MDARYKAFAKADAFLIDSALYVPNSQQARGQLVSFIKPYTRMFAATGSDQYKYKGVELQSEMITGQQYAEREAEVLGK